MQDRKLGQLLVEEGLISQDDLSRALAEQKSSGRRLGEILLELGLIDEVNLLRVLARQHRTQYLTTKKLSELNIPEAIIRLIPEHICEKNQLFPIQYKSSDKTLVIAMSDPSNVEALDEVRFVSGISNVKPLVALSSAIESAIRKWYKGDPSAFAVELEGISPTDFYPGQEDMIELEPEPSSSGSSLPEPEIIDFQRLLKEEPNEEESEIILGAKAKAQKEPEIIIEEIEEPAQTQAKSVPLEPVIEPIEETGAVEPAKIKPEPKRKPEEQKRAFEQKYRRKIIVIEGHEQIRKFIIKLFTSEGFQVRGFSSLKEALPELESGEYDALVIKEKYLEEPSAEFEEKFQREFPKVELCIIKNYGFAVIGETRSYQRLTSSFLETLDVLLGLLELEGGGVQGHSHNVAKYSRLIANKLELSLKEVDAITLSAYIHDLGKKGIKPYSILDIDATSDPSEIMEQAEIPLKLLGGAKFPFDIESIIRHQYERWDGRGIPDGLKGEEIPVGARILALVDAYEDLTNPGLNENPLEPGEALEQLNRQAGKIFDPQIVELFMSVVRDDIYLKRVEVAQDKILLADTEFDLTTLLELRLVKEGFGVIIARNGKEALEKARSEMPSLIITEVDLPEKSGLEFISELKEDEKTRSIPFIFLSRKDDPSVVTKALDLGAEDYITKPIKVDVFCAKIKTMLARLKEEKKVAVPQPVGVTGSLSEMSLPDIVQILGAGRKTARVTLENNGKTAYIYLEDGRVVNAEIDDLKGEEAFYKILWWNEGTFTIDPNVEITERLINMSNDSLMLEGFRRMDEELKEKGELDEDLTLDGEDFI